MKTHYYLKQIRCQKLNFIIDKNVKNSPNKISSQCLFIDNLPRYEFL